MSRRSRESSKYARREAVELWKPKAHELQLPHVPPEERRAIRKKLSPILAILHDYDDNPVGVKFGDCWNIAQSLTLTAQDADIQYVEGAWAWGTPHGWNLVNGYVVDLVDERTMWEGREAERFREPLNVYSYREVNSFYEDYFGGWEIMSVHLDSTFPQVDFDYDDDNYQEEFDAYLSVQLKSVFWSALEKLTSQHSAEQRECHNEWLAERSEERLEGVAA